MTPTLLTLLTILALILAYKHHPTWTQGRQNTGYWKLTLIQTPYFDTHILTYPPNSHIPPHTDPTTNRNHYRINIILQHAQKGGHFQIQHTILNLPRIKIFRPDQHTHQLTKIEQGTRIILSIGYTTPKKNKSP